MDIGRDHSLSKDRTGLEDSSMDQEKTVSSTTKKVVEFEVVESDRIDLIAQANRFIDSMRSTACGAMTEVELDTYNSALAFLNRQFSDGFKDSETIETRVELEISG
jgi:hypothetical protein